MSKLGLLEKDQGMTKKEANTTPDFVGISKLGWRAGNDNIE